MIEILAAAVLGTAVPCTPAALAFDTPVSAAHAARGSETLRELYDGGLPFAEFLGRAEARKANWHENWGAAAVPAELLAAARAIPGQWRLLAVAVDGCSDSVNSIPAIAKLVELVPDLDMRIIDSKVGRTIMEGHRTKDGRAATPTLLLLDADYGEAGCWVERPLKLQEWYAEKQEAGVPINEITQQKMGWYKEDAGREILREIVEMMRAAASGNRICSSDPA